MDAYAVPVDRVPAVLGWLTAHGEDTATIRPGSLSIDDDDPQEPLWPLEVRWVTTAGVETRVSAPRAEMETLLFG